MAKKTVVEDEVVSEEETVVAPRIQTDFGRTDLNELRDAVNELFAR